MTRTDDWYPRTVFFTADVARAAAHYCQVLGFAQKWCYPTSPEEGRVIAAQVERAGLEIILNEHEGRPGGGGRIFLSLAPGQSQAFADEARAAGADVSSGHWGMPVLIVRDLDGNELFCFDDALQESAT